MTVYFIGAGPGAFHDLLAGGVDGGHVGGSLRGVAVVGACTAGEVRGRHAGGGDTVVQVDVGGADEFSGGAFDF